MRKTTKSPGEKIVKDIKRATRKAADGAFSPGSMVMALLNTGGQGS